MITPKPPSLEARQLARLMDISQTLNATHNSEELLQFIIKTACELLECEEAVLLIHDEKRNRLYIAAVTGSEPKKFVQTPIPLDGSIAGSIFREDKSLILNDVAHDVRYFSSISTQTNFQAKTLVGAPMRIRDKGVGVIEAINKRNGIFTDADERLLSFLASQAASAIHNTQLIQALQKANEDLQETDRLKSNFMALASHELRTPLGIIIGYASFLQADNEGEVSEHAERVLSAASQMRSLIEAMTSLHLLQAKGLTFKPRVVPVQQVLNAAYEEMREIAEEMHHTVTFNLPAQSLLVTADPDKLTPAFVNILNNAIRFTPHGGQITISAVQRSGNIQVNIQDSGIGIAPDQLTKIFQEFYQVEPHTTRRFGGLGIGLTIAKGLIETQSGRIWAESEGLNKGTNIRVLLPPAGTSTLSGPI